LVLRSGPLTQIDQWQLNVSKGGKFIGDKVKEALKYEPDVPLPEYAFTFIKISYLNTIKNGSYRYQDHRRALMLTVLIYRNPKGPITATNSPSLTSREVYSTQLFQHLPFRSRIFSNSRNFLSLYVFCNFLGISLGIRYEGKNLRLPKTLGFVLKPKPSGL